MNIGLIVILNIFYTLKLLRSNKKHLIFNNIRLNKNNILFTGEDINTANDLRTDINKKHEGFT